jgi:glycosyltransferase involved in cell wall biosynthesis
MPIYNGIEFIEESVSSILRQNYEQWELIVGVNGHPKDSYVYVLAKEYEKHSEKIRVFDFYNIKGKSNTLNEMIQFCNYNYVALLDVDDIWHDEKLKVQSQMLDYYDVIGSNCIWFGDRECIVPPIPVGDISNYDFTIVNPIINSSSITRKNLCKWNENGIEDYDLWLRLRKQNKKFYNFKEILVKHRIHNNSAFNSKGNNNKVDDLLMSHGFNSRHEIKNKTAKISIPKLKTVNKMKMNLC